MRWLYQANWDGAHSWWESEASSSTIDPPDQHQGLQNDSGQAGNTFWRLDQIARINAVLLADCFGWARPAEDEVAQKLVEQQVAWEVLAPTSSYHWLDCIRRNLVHMWEFNNFLFQGFFRPCSNWPLRPPCDILEHKTFITFRYLSCHQISSICVMNSLIWLLD